MPILPAEYLPFNPAVSQAEFLIARRPWCFAMVDVPFPDIGSQNIEAGEENKEITLIRRLLLRIVARPLYGPLRMEGSAQAFG